MTDATIPLDAPMTLYTALYCRKNMPTGIGLA